MKIQPSAPAISVPTTPAAVPAGPADPVDGYRPRGSTPTLPDMARAAGLFRQGTDQLWRSQVGGAFSEPRMGPDGTILAGHFDHHVYGLDPQTGATRWSYKTESHLDDPPALGPDGRLYATSRDLDLHILAPSGRLLDKVRVGATTSGPVVDAKGRVFVGTIHGEFKAFDADGAPLWEWKLKDPHEPGFMVSPVIGPDGTVYCTSSGGTVTALDPATGEPRWSRKPTSGIYTEAVAGADGRLYVPSLDGTIHCLDGATGETAWSHTAEASLACSPVIRGDRLWVLCDMGQLACLRTSDGGVEWKAEMGGGRREAGPILGHDDTIFVGDEDKHLVALTASTGKEKWRLTMDGSPGKGTVSQDGSTLYVAVGRQGLAAVPTRSVAQRLQELQETPPSGPSPEIREEASHVDIGGIRLPRKSRG